MNDPCFVDVLDGLEDRADEFSGITALGTEREPAQLRFEREISKGMLVCMQREETGK